MPVKEMAESIARRLSYYAPNIVFTLLVFWVGFSVGRGTTFRQFELLLERMASEHQSKEGGEPEETSKITEEQFLGEAHKQWDSQIQDQVSAFRAKQEGGEQTEQA